MKYLCSLLCAVFLFSCSNMPKPNEINENEVFERVADEYESRYQDDEAEKKSNLLPEVSLERLEKGHKELLGIYNKIELIDPAKLSEKNKINHSVLRFIAKNAIDNFTYGSHYMPLTAESGFHNSITSRFTNSRLTSTEDFDQYLQKLEELPRYFAQQTELMTKGIELGYTQPQVVLNGFENSIIAYVKDDPTKSLYYRAAKRLPDYFTAEQKVHYKSAISKSIESNVFPTYQKFYDFMVNTYIPSARQEIGAVNLPNGSEFYENRIQHYTTLEMTAEEVHKIGLEEVKRIRGEMEAIIEELEFEGSFEDFVEFLRTDEQFYAKTPTELLKEASYIAKKMDAELPKFFKRLPRTPYGVAPVPDNIAPKYTTGRYIRSRRDDQPGFYWVNTYRLDRRPLYVLEALTLHEAVPGHHLQISLSQEMKNVPKYRTNTYISAFGEGWALYTEYLGLEAGFYKDPYSNFGRLTYEMWRACRLAIDTGVHVMGWSREQAIEFLGSNTALSSHNVRTEVDRYISWPGQAVSYKIGELTIKKLRSNAERELGNDFDLREFHDEVLKNGAVPLATLDVLINQYIEAKKIEKSKK